MAVAAGGLWYAKRREAQRKQVVKPATVTRPDEISCTGKVQAAFLVPVPATIDGSIEEFLAEPGQEVYEGQLLARLKNTVLESARDSAAGELERAQTRVQRLEAAIIQARLEASRARADAMRSKIESDRLEKIFLRQQLLHREGAAPRLVFEKAQKEYDEARSESSGLDAVSRNAEDQVMVQTRELDAARKTFDEKSQAFDQAKTDLAAAEVHAPVDGLLVSRHGEVGQEITREVKDLFQIAVDLSVLEVSAEADPQSAAFVQPGQPVAVQLVEAGSEALPGVVKDVNGTHIRIEFRNPSPAVKPGLTAQVRIRIS